MRVPFAIVAGALLIAASILVVGRHSVGDIEVFNTGEYVVYGIDQWTSEPFVKVASVQRE
jgi:hypothetical protein